MSLTANLDPRIHINDKVYLHIPQPISDNSQSFQIAESKDKVSKVGIELDFDLRKILEHLLMKNGSSPVSCACTNLFTLLFYLNYEN